MINENKSSYYPEIYPYKKGVYSPYNTLYTIMRNILLIIFILGNLSFSVGQNSNVELLNEYNFYIEKNIEMGKWSKKIYLKNGLPVIEESYWKKELRHRTEFEYDKHNNIKKETETFEINEGKVNNVSDIKLRYDNGLLTHREYNYGLREKYSDFNELGKPKVIERIEESDFKIWPNKELIEYDNQGNITKSTEYSTYEDLNGKTINEIATTYYKYDDKKNVIGINREFEPKQEFPIIITGGPSMYEYEYYRYKYNKNGLWTKKYKTVNGKEYLVALRKYK